MNAFLKNIYKIIFNYFIKDTKYFFLYLFRYFQKFYKNNCLFFDKLELIKLLEDGKSIIRIGDGEIGLIHYLDIGYQPYSDSIRRDFIKIIKNYNDKSNYILGIPVFVNYTNKELKETKGLHNYFKCWMPLKITYELIFNKKAKYIDAHVFYRNSGFKNLLESFLKNKKIVLVTNKKNIEEISELSLPFVISDYVPCVDTKSYDFKDEIKNKIINSVNSLGDCKNVVVLMSAGLAKTVIFDLANKGFQIIDVGKGLEGYYQDISLDNLI